jgi:hypothetical protein
VSKEAATVGAIYVPLKADVKDALIKLADRELRDPRRQASLLLTDALRRAGALPTDNRQAAGSPGPCEAA